VETEFFLFSFSFSNGSFIMADHFESGVTFGERSWHGKEDNRSADDEARYSMERTLELSGMDWETVKVPLVVAPEQGELSGAEATDCFGVFRTDINRCLAHVGSDYTCLKNRDIFERFQPFADARQLAFESAGALDEGRRVYVQARLSHDDIDIGGGDLIKPLLLLASSHDCSLATHIGFTPQRVVCDNTLSAAIGRGGLLRVKHTKGQQEALDSLMETVDLARGQFVASCEKYHELLETPINSKDLEKYVKLVLDIVEVDDKKISQRTVNQFEKIVTLALYGKGQSPDKLTAWSAYNGVTEWTSHFRQSDQNTRLKSVWFGASQKTNRKALDLALTLAS